MRIVTLASVPLVVSLSGCVSIDGRSWREPVSKEGPAHLSGRFTTKAAYVSKKMNFKVGGNLADLMRVRDAQAADTVTMSFTKGVGLTIRFEKNSEEILSKVYRLEDGLRITDDGKIELPSTGRCDVGLVQGIPGAGCQSKMITLYPNQSGDLIAVESHIAGAILAILPIGVYGEGIAIFPRVGKDACDFVRRGIYSCN